MAQLIVTLDNTSQVSAIKKAISLIRGVAGVSVQKGVSKTKMNTENTVSSSIMGLMGIASKINKKDIEKDDRLSYLLSR